MPSRPSATLRRLAVRRTGAGAALFSAGLEVVDEAITLLVGEVPKDVVP